jgi:hypothetical protein
VNRAALRILMKKGVVFAVFFIVFAGMIFAKLHPGIKWREISDEQFIVIYPQGYESEAFHTLEIAGDIYEKLHKLWGNRVRKRIRIVLSDSYDFANGSATFFPFNWIEIYLYAPPPDSAIGGCRDWIYMVLSHEMNHIFNMNAGSGFTDFMRRLAGSNPVFFPMIYAPVWLAEGWAVYAESRLGSGGRLDTPDFEIMLKEINTAGNVPDSARIYGEPTSWPGPTSSYLYGAKFVAFLAKKYGEHKVRELARHFGYHFVPLLMSSRFKEVFGKGLNRLWGEFIDDITIETGKNKSRIDILTTGGLMKTHPVFGPGKKIFYVEKNYKEFPGIYEMDLSTGKNRRLLKKTGINSLYYDKNCRKIYFSAVRYFKTYYRYSDLYEFDIDRKKVKRLSAGRRLSYPVRCGKKIYCVKRVKARSFLAVLDSSGGKEKIISKGYDSLSHISISPDHTHIAATLKEKHSSWHIALFNLSGEFLRLLTGNDVISYAPSWKDSDTICFITEDGGHYRLASCRLTTGYSHIYRDKTVPDLKYFSFHPGDGRLLVSFFDANGFNLGLLRNPLLPEDAPAGQGESGLENICFSGKLPQREPTGSGVAHRDERSKKYNPFRDLLPKYFSINYRDGGREMQPGIYLSGIDALQRHSFILETFYGFRSSSLNLNFNYTYDGLYPTLLFNYTQYTDLYQYGSGGDYNFQSKKIELAAQLPLSFNEKRQSYLYAGIYFERIKDGYFITPGEKIRDYDGIKLAYLFSSLKKYYDSISYADGVSFALSYALENKLSESFAINTLACEYRQFLSIFRPNVFALRLAVSDSWGEGRRLFYMGGAESQDGFSITGSNMFTLMRGFPKGYFSGYGGYLLNLEYRLSLFKVERVFTVIRSIDRVYLALFTDMGNLWRYDKKMDPAYSYGFELNVVIHIADSKFNFSGGMALGRHPYSAPVYYIRIGRSF